MATTVSPMLATALPSLPAVLPAAKHRTTRDLMESDPKRNAHKVSDEQFEHFLMLVADGVRAIDALATTNMTRVGFEHVLRINDAARARYEEAKIQALYKNLDLETVEGVLADVARGKFLHAVLADRLIDSQDWYRLCLKDPLIKELYEEARMMQSESWTDEMREIAADDSRDIIESERETDSGQIITERKPNNTAVQRDKLKADNMKWLMARLHHERFGDKQKIDLNANVTIDYASRLEAARTRKTQAKIKARESA